MEKMNDLRDLLKHEIEDLYSAEEQIIEAMPMMIENANDPALKTALREHLAITKKQKARLDQVQKLMNDGKSSQESKGLFSRLFGGGTHKCKGTEGIIDEGNKIMGEDMNPEVMDAAIIASAQKIEHYEICGYGTAKAYARELKLDKVAALLDETLSEEYEADDKLTAMAVGRLNEEAKVAGNEPASSNTRSRQNGGNPSSKQAAATGRSTGRSSNASSGSKSGSSSGRSSGSSSSSTGSRSASKKSASKKGLSTKSSAKGSSAASKSGGSKSSPKKAATAGKKSSSSRGR